MAAQDSRCESAPAKHGFGIVRRVDVVFKAGRRPHICVCVCARLGDPRLSHPITETLVLRDGDGKRTRAYRIWQERSRLPSMVPAEDVGGGAGRAGRRRIAALVAAVANAERSACGRTRGSEGCVAAKARLAALGVSARRVLC